MRFHMGKEKKVILALWGPQGTGKTTTLRKLALEFLDSPEVEEDIQIGFLYYKENEEKPTKIVVSTTKDARVNADFYTGLTAKPVILVITTRTEDQTGEINLVAELVKEEGAKREQKEIDTKLKPKIEGLINSKAKAQEETTTLCQFLLRLLESEVVEGDIQITFNYKGKRIVISTAGDDYETVKEGTDLFKALKADILVTVTRSKGYSRGALKDLEEDGEIKTKAIRIYQSNLTHGESNGKEETEPLKESITEEQIEILKELINEGQAKILKATIDLIIDKWEEQSEDNPSR